MRKRRKWQLFLLVVLVPFLFLIFFFHHTVSPLIEDLAKARIENRGSYIINEAIEEQLRSDEIQYESIVFLDKNMYGEVTALKTNISEINRLKTQILSMIDTMFLDLDINEIGLPLGSLILPELFSGTGPKLPVKVMSISATGADFHNEFSEAGINQTLHRIMMDVFIKMTVLTPVGTQEITVESSVVVAETVIIGEVPESYVNVRSPFAKKEK